MLQGAWSDAAPLQPSPGSPLHERLRELIREKIRAGALAPGDVLPPEIELAQAYGVSRTTIRRALADLTVEGLLRRVPGQGTYVQQPRIAAIKAVAVICPFLGWYMPDLIDGIEHVVKLEGHELIVRNSAKKVDVESAQIEAMVKTASGIILWPTSPEFSTSPSEAIQELLKGSVPVVVVNQATGYVDSVTTDNFGGGYLVGQHLLGLGRTRIGYVAPYEHLPYTLKTRLEGLQEAIRNGGLSRDGGLLFTAWPDEERFFDWFEQKSPEALFCANDLVAIEVIQALARRSIAVPADVAVVGYGDIPLAANTFPPLTTVKQHIGAVGQSAARLLIERIRTCHRPPRKLALPVQLQVRGSCGARNYPSPVIV